MTSEERYGILVKDLTISLQGFEKALLEDSSVYSIVVQDLINNGRVQKFEICVELAWKTAKLFIEINLGEVIVSPKLVFRFLFTANLITVKLLGSLLLMIDDRNQLSHIYNEENFLVISHQFKQHLSSLQQLRQLFI